MRGSLTVNDINNIIAFGTTWESNTIIVIVGPVYIECCENVSAVKGVSGRP